jgi:hypothetical protein
MSQPWLPAQPATPGGLAGTNLWNQPPIVATGDWFYWDGFLIRAFTIEGWWDGAAIQPIDEAATRWWDGAVAQMVQPAQ